MTSSRTENSLKAFFRLRGKAFRYAFAGWAYVMRTQRNAWIHALMSVAVIAVSLWLKISLTDWAIIILTIAMVWIAEFFNTALEAVADLASNQEQHELARVGKDVSAAAVLIAALASVVVGLLVLGPPLWTKIQAWISR
ncbi:MAG: diacylglycerol kinase family protein [Anaerolineales bacterium]|nr:diacylglycerol kinase family protein [Anaerolineales bacterium]